MSKKINIAIILCISYANASMYYSSIQAMVKNNSPHVVNLLCLTSGPTIDRYSKESGWFYNKWPLTNLEPGHSESVELYIGREAKAKLAVVVMYSDCTKLISGDDMIANYFKLDSGLYAGTATFYKDENRDISTVHSGKLDCTISGSESKYTLQLVVN